MTRKNRLFGANSTKEVYSTRVHFGRLAQSAEHAAVNRSVEGSSPSFPAKVEFSSILATLTLNYYSKVLPPFYRRG